MVLILILAHILPVACKLSPTSHAPKPKDFNVKVISSSQVLLVWTKDLGPGYRYRISVNMTDIVMREIEGSMGFGRIGAVVINGLIPAKEYGFVVKHECEAFPKKYSYNKYAKVQTLDAGKCDFFEGYITRNI